MNDDAILHFFAEDGPLSSRIPGYRPRQAQIDMALMVDRSLETPGAKLVVEAGTGTGKSFAYLVPALLRGMKIAVATGTKALQDQLFYKDVPVVVDALKDAFGLVKRATLMKGRNNYLCHIRYETFRQRPMFTFADDAKHMDRLVKFAEKTQTGDRADVDGLPDDWRTWGDLDASAETCLGSKCLAFEECYVTKMRRHAEIADLLVVNHHLLCADARVRLEGMPKAGEGSRDDLGFAMAKVIPDVDALIVDEAHGLVDVATNYFGVSFSMRRAERLIADVRRSLTLLDKSRADMVEREIDALLPVLHEVFTTLKDGSDAVERVRVDRLRGIDAARSRALVAASLLDKLAERMELESTGGSDQSVDLELQGVVRRTTQAGAELRFIVERGLVDPAFVTSLEREGTTLTASPIDVSQALSRTLFASSRPVVLTSATLTVGGDATGFLHKAGLPKDDAATAVAVLASPFSFEENAALYAPKDFPDPNAPEFPARFDDEAKFLVEEVNGGALLLFTSHRALERSFNALAARFVARGLIVMRQGAEPKASLLARLRDAPREKGAVLFATASFWEGVDVPGDALRLVVIDRLPFKSPGDPLIEARNELARSRGISPFFDVAVPEAALLLKQGVGRLIRTETDVGVVAILDGRIRTKGYGRTFLDALPPLLRLGSREALTRFVDVKMRPRFAKKTPAA